MDSQPLSNEYSEEVLLEKGANQAPKADFSNKFKKTLEELSYRLSLKDRILFIKQLSILMKAGIPVLSSLRMIKEQSKSKSLSKILEKVIYDVENGQYLASALGKFKKLFGPLTISIISVGEHSGSLASSLDHLASTLKKQHALRKRIIGASIYPAFIIVATFVITALLTVFFFPKVVPVLKSVNYDLPWTTKALIFISDALKMHGILVLLFLVVLVVSIALLLRNKRIRFYFQKFLLKIPFLNKFIYSYNTANICRTLGLLLNSSVMVVRSFQITSETTPNLVYKEKLALISAEILKGEKIAPLMKDRDLFPLMVSQMIQIGESTGKLSDTFLYLANIQEDEMDDLTRNVSTVIEPMLLILMGLLVGFIAISIIAPIYGITQHLNPK